MDFEPNDAALRPWLEKGVTFVKDRVAPDNLGSLLGHYLASGDLLIDLAWNIDVFSHRLGAPNYMAVVVRNAAAKNEVYETPINDNRQPGRTSRLSAVRPVISTFPNPGEAAVSGPVSIWSCIAP